MLRCSSYLNFLKLPKPGCLEPVSVENETFCAEMKRLLTTMCLVFLVVGVQTQQH